jgi:bacterioferritin (cytochrome b1)
VRVEVKGFILAAVKADPKIIGDLLATCGQLATIQEQYRVDAYAIRNLGLKDLGRKFYPKWHCDIEGHLDKIIKQLNNFGEDVSYSMLPAQSGGDIRALLTRDAAMLNQTFGSLCLRRKAAWDARADYVPDLYEHAIDTVQSQINHVERWLRIIAGIGPGDFVGALVEV